MLHAMTVVGWIGLALICYVGFGIGVIFMHTVWRNLSSTLAVAAWVVVAALAWSTQPTAYVTFEQQMMAAGMALTVGVVIGVLFQAFIDGSKEEDA